MATIINVANIFQPLEPGKLSQDFRRHYEPIFGAGITDEEIISKVYGGKPLQPLYKQIQFSATEQQIDNVQATITLIPAETAAVQPLELRNVTLKQFLVAGLPWIHNGTTPGAPGPNIWDGGDNWNKLHQQYRLELCHSEICRWSIFFKRDGELQGGLTPDDATGHEQFSRIELVNNCTTWYGFEFRIEFDGDTYHGSFGSKPSTGVLKGIYSELSQHQAGSYARQTDKLAGGDQPRLPSFGFGTANDIYDNFNGWGPSRDAVSENTISIDLDRYYRGATMSERKKNIKVCVAKGKIDYERWGADSEYFKKAKIRRLMIAHMPSGENAIETKELPVKYSDIYKAKYITLPDFWPNGVYQIDQPRHKHGYTWLKDLKKCAVAKHTNNRFTIELQRSKSVSGLELRRIVFGNLDLTNIPVYDSNRPEETVWTLDRFGYGPRKTELPYLPGFIPPHGNNEPAPFAFVLAGLPSDKTSRANHYVCPEPFGIERAIFSWANSQKSKLIIDLMSFERILPVWQGEIDFSDTPFSFRGGLV